MQAVGRGPIAAVAHRSGRCAAVLLLVLALTRTAAATPGQELSRARTEFRAGNFPQAISVLSTLLYPNNKLSDKSQIAEAHLLLGVAYLETGNSSGADQEFEEALFIDRSLSLDPLLFSTGAIKAFEDKKDKVLARIQQQEAERELLRQKAEFDAIVRNSLVVEKRDYWINFVPFGFGQFQNGQPTKGTAIAITQAALAGTSLTLWGYQVFNYGYRGKVPADEVDTVNKIQVAQIGTSVGFFLVWAYGIVDSLNSYEPSIQRRVVDDPELIKKLREDQNERDQKKNKTKTKTRPPKPEKSSFKILPTPVPDGMGVGISWEF